MSYQRLKGLVKRAAHTKVLCLFLYGAVVTLWMYFNDRTLLLADWDYYVLGLGALVLLAVWEQRQDVPLPFMSRLTSGEFLVIAMIAFFLPSFIERAVLEQELPFTSANSIVYYFLAWYASVAILEESYKVGITNLVTMLFRWSFRKRGSEKLNKIMVFVIGSATVASWAFRHPYSIKVDAFVFVTGMIYFALILWKKNYLPVVAAHILNNWVVFFLAFSLFSSVPR